MTVQPLLHDLAVTVGAPTVVLASRAGDVDATAEHGGAQGLFQGDVRALSRLVLTVDGLAPRPIGDVVAGSGRHRFVSLVRHLGDPWADPTVRVDRLRQVSPGRLQERVVVSSWATEPVDAVVELALSADLLPVDAVKAGRPGRPAQVVLSVDGALRWSSTSVDVSVRAPGAVPDVGDDGRTGLFRWAVHLAAGSRAELVVTVDVDDRAGVVLPAGSGASWARPELTADDRRLTALVDQSLDDLHALRMTDVESPGEVFVAAGAPWFFTLFGRDSLWVARMMLPLGTDLARSTLRVLAHRQGRVSDPAAEQEPGKILHELRRATYGDGDGLALPPVYYGTVDATPLWVCLLRDAYRWGLAVDDVVPLLPALQAALGWIADAAETGGGFLRYVDHSGVGLTNQGWKDSGDAVRYADGTPAVAPLALAEVQGYAYEAAQGGADLLEAFDLPGADRWRGFAADLRRRFRDHFWVDDADGPYPAMALDGGGRPADAVASNMGHLLTSGLLDDDEIDAVAGRLTGPGLDSGFGLRTMSSSAAGYGPMRYHCGTVWPHDTAIAVAGLVRTGHAAGAAGLVEGLLAASVAFDSRLPELWAGDARADISVPVPYPAACRPQAWAAASAVSLVTSLLGLTPDVPRGHLDVKPMPGSPVGAVSARGLVVGGRRLDVDVDAQGRVTRLVSEAGLDRQG